MFPRVWPVPGLYRLMCEAEQRPRVFLDGEVGELRFVINELKVSAVPGMHFIVYTPQDEQTRARLAQLRK